MFDSHRQAFVMDKTVRDAIRSNAFTVYIDQSPKDGPCASERPFGLNDHR